LAGRDRSHTPPAVAFGAAGAHFVAQNVTLLISAMLANGSLAPALELDVSGSVNATISLGGAAENITIKLVRGEAQRTLSVALRQSWVGAVPQISVLSTV
jgi:hypothetical protein